MCLVSGWWCCWLVYVALCSGRSSEERVEVLEGGGGEDLEEGGDDVVEEVALVRRGWERWLREYRWNKCAGAGLCMISVTPSHCDNGGLIVVVVQSCYLNVVSHVMLQRPG